MSALQDREAARDWLAAGLSLVRVGAPGADAVRDAAPLLEAAGAELAALPPPGVLVDLARLFLDARQDLRRQAPADLAGVLRPYEDGVLGRLVTDPLRLALSDAVGGLPPRLRPSALIVILERFLERVGFTGSEAVHPGVLRELDRTTADDWIARSSPALQGDAGRRLERAYTQLVACVQRTGRLLRASDVVVVQQLQLLERRSDRLALTQVVAAAELLAVGLPRRVRNTRRRAGHVSTQLLDDSAYPVGGFSSISTQGSIENLVTSELVLMEDGDDVDLFDIRYMEGELLYYTRDETAFVRARRAFTISFDAALVDARYRDPGLPYQRLVLALGWVVALVRVLLRWLDRQELQVRIVMPPEGLDPERRLLELTLAEGIHAGFVRIETHEASAIPGLVAADARTAPADWIAISAIERELPCPDHAWTTQLVCSARAVLHAPFAGTTEPPEDALGAWRRTLLVALLDLI